MPRDVVYLNNAATTWPKPDSVYAAVNETLRAFGSPRRGAVATTADPVTDARATVSDLLGLPSPDRLLLLPGATYALNLAILGLPWQADDVAIISGLEHHAVSRPIRKAVREHGIRLEVAPWSAEDPIDLDFVKRTLEREHVRLVACMMASNVTGQILPVRAIVELAHEHGALVLLDAAQAAGVVPIDVAALGADMVAFAGHKGLFGPTGVGGLWAAPHVELRPLAEGGTGGDSGKHELQGIWPTDYEVGTLNAPAIAGLDAGARWVAQTGLDAIHAREAELLGLLLTGLERLDRVTIHGPLNPCRRTAAVSITVDGMAPAEVAARLTAQGIACRAGFHCAPLAHETIGTLASGGTVRLSPGYFNTRADIQTALDALEATIASRVG